MGLKTLLATETGVDTLMGAIFLALVTNSGRIPFQNDYIQYSGPGVLAESPIITAFLYVITIAFMTVIFLTSGILYRFRQRLRSDSS